MDFVSECDVRWCRMRVGTSTMLSLFHSAACITFFLLLEQEFKRHLGSKRTVLCSSNFDDRNLHHIPPQFPPRERLGVEPSQGF